MKPIILLDNTLKVEVRYACEDKDLADNILRQDQRVLPGG